MQYKKGLKEFDEKGRTAITLGKFDGLHRGHEKLVEKVIECAGEAGLKSVVCAFDMLSFPGRVQKGRSILMTGQERRVHLSDRVDYLVECPFTKEFSCMEAEDFIRDVLCGLFHAAYVVVGTDFSFGHGKRGDLAMLAQYQETYGYQLLVLDKERYRDREISSTYIREVLKEGNLSLVNTLLGYPYRITGQVEHGRKLGRKLGFPTMNVTPDPHKLLPPNGVYLVTVKIRGAEWAGVANIGVKPTVAEEKRLLVEVHLFDYDAEVYGEEVEIRLHAFRRPEQEFPDLDTMKACVRQDILYGKQFFHVEEG